MQQLLQLPTTNQLQLYEFRDENFETSIVIVVLTYWTMDARFHQMA
jgi:hypothetical protein